MQEPLRRFHRNLVKIFSQGPLQDVCEETDMSTVPQRERCNMQKVTSWFREQYQSELRHNESNSLKVRRALRKHMLEIISESAAGTRKSGS